MKTKGFKYTAILLVVLAVIFIASSDIAFAQVLSNPLGGAPQTPQTLIGRAIKYLFGIAGSLALLNFVISGVKMISSGGNADKFNDAKTSMLYTVAGILIMFASYGIIEFVLRAFQDAA